MAHFDVNGTTFMLRTVEGAVFSPSTAAISIFFIYLIHQEKSIRGDLRFLLGEYALVDLLLLSAHFIDIVAGWTPEWVQTSKVYIAIYLFISMYALGLERIVALYVEGTALGVRFLLPIVAVKVFIIAMVLSVTLIAHWTTDTTLGVFFVLTGVFVLIYEIVTYNTSRREREVAHVKTLHLQIRTGEKKKELLRSARATRRFLLFQSTAHCLGTLIMAALYLFIRPSFPLYVSLGQSIFDVVFIGLRPTVGLVIFLSSHSSLRKAVRRCFFCCDSNPAQPSPSMPITVQSTATSPLSLTTAPTPAIVPNLPVHSSTQQAPIIVAAHPRASDYFAPSYHPYQGMPRIV